MSPETVSLDTSHLSSEGFKGTYDGSQRKAPSLRNIAKRSALKS